MPEQESQEGDVDLPDDEECETEFEKTVTMVGYDSDLDFPSIEEWAEQLTGEPCTEKSTSRNKKTYLVFDLGRGECRTRLKDYNFENAKLDELKESLNSVPEELLRIEQETERVTNPAATLGDASSALLEELYQQCPDVLSGGVGRAKYLKKWQNDNSMWSVKLSNSSFGQRRVLSKESERSSDDRYETMSEVPAFSFTVKIEAPTEEFIDLWTEEVIKSLHKAMSSHDDIGKVRYMSCTVTQEKRGECYGV